MYYRIPLLTQWSKNHPHVPPPTGLTHTVPVRRAGHTAYCRLISPSPGFGGLPGVLIFNSLSTPSCPYPIASFRIFLGKSNTYLSLLPSSSSIRPAPLQFTVPPLCVQPHRCLFHSRDMSLAHSQCFPRLCGPGMNSSWYQYSPWVKPTLTPVWICNHIFLFRLFNISYSDYGAFRNQPPPKPH